MEEFNPRKEIGKLIRKFEKAGYIFKGRASGCGEDFKIKLRFKKYDRRI